MPRHWRPRPDNCQASSLAPILKHCRSCHAAPRHWVPFVPPGDDANRCCRHARPRHRHRCAPVFMPATGTTGIFPLGLAGQAPAWAVCLIHPLDKGRNIIPAEARARVPRPDPAGTHDEMACRDIQHHDVMRSSLHYRHDQQQGHQPRCQQEACRCVLHSACRAWPHSRVDGSIHARHALKTAPAAGAGLRAESAVRLGHMSIRALPLLPAQSRCMFQARLRAFVGTLALSGGTHSPGLHSSLTTLEKSSAPLPAVLFMA